MGLDEFLRIGCSDYKRRIHPCSRVKREMDRREKLDFPRKFGSGKKLSGLLVLFLISIKNNADFYQFIRIEGCIVFTYVLVAKVYQL